MSVLLIFLTSLAGDMLPSWAVPLDDLAFIRLCIKGTAQEVEAAIKAGANINAVIPTNQTPLNRAIENPDLDVITVLIRNGADVNAKGENGETLLMKVTSSISNPWTIAGVRKPTLEVIEVLVKNGADINARDNRGRTAFMKAAEWQPTPNIELINVFLKNGADINAKDNDGKTALINAIGYALFPDHNLEVITFLLNNGADATIKDNEGYMAIAYARGNIKNINTDVFRRLQNLSNSVSAAVDPKSALIGQWTLSESNLSRNSVAQTIEFFEDGVGIAEGQGRAVSFTWRIDADGRLILISPAGSAQIYSIVISGSTLVLEGNTNYGQERSIYLKRR